MSDSLDDMHEIEKELMEFWLAVLRQDQPLQEKFWTLDEISKIQKKLGIFKEQHILSYPPTSREEENAESTKA